MRPSSAGLPPAVCESASGGWVTAGSDELAWHPLQEHDRVARSVMS
jgi:hypothetical protein